jgi:hypothetical protein
MRRVLVFKNIQKRDDAGVMRNVQVSDFTGTFHQFAQEADGEGQSNPVAIVERDDGSVVTVYCGLVQFIDRARFAGVTP